jgi:hypothetical protein
VKARSIRLEIDWDQEGECVLRILAAGPVQSALERYRGHLGRQSRSDTAVIVRTQNGSPIRTHPGQLFDKPRLANPCPRRSVGCRIKRQDRRSVDLQHEGRLPSNILDAAIADLPESRAIADRNKSLHGFSPWLGFVGFAVFRQATRAAAKISPVPSPVPCGPGRERDCCCRPRWPNSPG